MKNILDSKKFWKTTFLQISIEKINQITPDDFLSEELNTFFEDALRLLNVEPDEYYLSDMKNLSNPVDIAIKKFENHPNVQAIKQNISVNNNFYFSNTEVSDILKETSLK